MLIIPLAPNQRRVARGCESSGIAQVAEARPRAIEAALRELRDPDRRAHLAAAGRAMVDGRGAERAAAALLERWFPAGERMPTGG
jgi:spore coat polysaccharide biosynthesis predicted glycosyltransferase SpsG